MKITFLGSGGGRWVVFSQMRATGGWILEMDNQVFHVDPGPGALVRAKNFGINLRKVTGILVSHAHPDHYADAEMVIEAMTLGVKSKKGVVIGNSNAMKGGKDYRQVFSPYHLNAVERHMVLEAGKSVKVGDVRIAGVPTSHGDEEGIGFVFEGEKRVGYTSDGEYYEGQEKYFKGCDILLVNCLRPRHETWPTHMNSNQAAKLIGEVKPKIAVLKHFGLKMLQIGPEKEAAWIENETGIKTIAATDGMVLESENSDFRIEKARQR